MKYKIRAGAPMHYKLGRCYYPGEIIEFDGPMKGMWLDPVEDSSKIIVPKKRGRPRKEVTDVPTS